jgi:hypothetical protein
LAAALFAAVAVSGPAVSTVDPVMLQSVAAHARELDAAMGQHATRWTVDPGDKACLLRDGDDKAHSRILFIRETGSVSMWLTPHAVDVAAKVASAQAYQLYFVPLGDHAPAPAVSEFGAVLWLEPLARTSVPGLAVAADPARLLDKYPGGFAVVLAQGDQTLLADIVRPDLLASLAALKKCRGGR